MDKPIHELAQFVRAATQTFRKGPEVVTHKEAGVTITDVYAMPPADEARTDLVDVHFMQIGFTEAAADEEEFLTLLAKSLAEIGEFGVMFTPETFADGPSYISTGRLDRLPGRRAAAVRAAGALRAGQAHHACPARHDRLTGRPAGRARHGDVHPHRQAARCVGGAVLGTHCFRQ